MCARVGIASESPVGGSASRLPAWLLATFSSSPGFGLEWAVHLKPAEAACSTGLSCDTAQAEAEASIRVSSREEGKQEERPFLLQKLLEMDRLMTRFQVLESIRKIVWGQCCGTVG